MSSAHRYAVPSLLIIAAFVMAASASAQAANTSPTVRSVLAAEDARFAAMVRADTLTMRDGLAEDLSYVHTSARRETKGEYLASIGAGTIQYEEFAPQERRVRLLGASAAAVVGLAHARARSGGQLFDANVRYLALYERVHERWRLVAWQTTRVP